jgi:hypothetical protein
MYSKDAIPWRHGASCPSEEKRSPAPKFVLSRKSHQSHLCRAFTLDHEPAKCWSVTCAEATKGSNFRFSSVPFTAPVSRRKPAVPTVRSHVPSARTGVQKIPSDISKGNPLKLVISRSHTGWRCSMNPIRSGSTSGGWQLSKKFGEFRSRGIARFLARSNSTTWALCWTTSG